MAMLDTGAETSLIEERFCRTNNLKLESLGYFTKILGVGGQVAFMVTHCCNVPVTLRGFTSPHTFHVQPNNSDVPVLLGCDYLHSKFVLTRAPTTPNEAEEGEANEFEDWDSEASDVQSTSDSPDTDSDNEPSDPSEGNSSDTSDDDDDNDIGFDPSVRWMGIDTPPDKPPKGGSSGNEPSKEAQQPQNGGSGQRRAELTAITVSHPADSPVISATSSDTGQEYHPNTSEAESSEGSPTYDVRAAGQRVSQTDDEQIAQQATFVGGNPVEPDKNTSPDGASAKPKRASVRQTKSESTVYNPWKRKVQLLPRAIVEVTVTLNIEVDPAKNKYLMYLGSEEALAEGIEMKDGPTPHDGKKFTILVANHTNKDITIRKGTPMGRVEPYEHMTDDRKARTDLPKKRPYGNVKGVTHVIDVQGAKPIKMNPTRTSWKGRQFISKRVQEMLDQGVIEPSDAAWSFPVVLAAKKNPDGSVGTRFCINCIKLNAVTKKNNYPLPNPDELLDKYAGMEYYGKVDCQSGFWHIPMDEASKDMTTFVTPEGMYRFNRMPFGVCNGPATFQMHVDKITAKARKKGVFAYIDDIIFFGRTFEEFKEAFRATLDCLLEAGFTIKPSKCEVGTDKLPFLGHVLSKAGVQTDDEKVAAIAQHQPPRTERQLRSFLGLANYYRKFIRNYAQRTSKMYELLRKTNSIRTDWTDDHTAEFNGIKEAFTTAPVLAKPGINPRLTRWALALQGKDITIEYKPGVFCDNADALSRWPLERPDDNDPHEELDQVHNFEDFKDEIRIRSLRVQRHEIKEKSRRHPDLILEPGGWTDEAKVRSLRAAAEWRQTTNMCRPVPKATPLPGCKVISDWNDLSTADVRIINVVVPDDPGSQGESRVGSAKVRTTEVNGPEASGSQGEPEDEEEKPIESNKELRRLQLRDPHLRKLIDELENQDQLDHKSKLLEHYQMSGGILYRLTTHNTKLERRFVVPLFMRKGIIRALHDGKTGNNFGRVKTLEAAKLRYYWDRMLSDVHDYVDNCPRCTLVNKPRTKPPGKLQKMEVGEPWFRVYADFKGPLPRTESKGYQYIAVVTDQFTKFTIARATKTNSAKEFEKFFVEDVVLKYGMPTHLHTDQGSHFTAKTFAKVAKIFGIQHTFGTAYHPEGQGQVERSMQTIWDGIRKECDAKDGHRWHRNLQYVVCGINRAKHATTGFSPYYMLYGREMTIPQDVITGTNAPEHYTDKEHYIKRMKERLQRAHDIAKTNIEYPNKDPTRKERYDGVWTVLNYKGPNNFWLRNVETGKEDVVAVDRCKHHPSNKRRRITRSYGQKKAEGTSGSNLATVPYPHEGQPARNTRARKANPAEEKPKEPAKEPQKLDLTSVQDPNKGPSDKPSPEEPPKPKGKRGRPRKKPPSDFETPALQELQKQAVIEDESEAVPEKPKNLAGSSEANPKRSVDLVANTEATSTKPKEPKAPKEKPAKVKKPVKKRPDTPVPAVSTDKTVEPPAPKRKYGTAKKPKLTAHEVLEEAQVAEDEAHKDILDRIAEGRAEPVKSTKPAKKPKTTKPTTTQT
ncbi:uncharacterized protein LOC129591981 [Paramacrobiotus metropolitanus]|uniref:uncharacterized protein LOC129591981 n=1 Tax=Paramacrobiotus metropolitanus TaxID=2943436 RepID=UPI0024460026|nr:uncharacterized protein LOC129591981 [Paramacrobiotus metropolitanus]